MSSFIGIDMAWKIDGNHSGIAVLAGDAEQVSLVALSTGVHSLAGIVHFVRTHASAETVAAIDASLVVTNQAGQRPCETEIARTFGRHHASCHTSNLSRPYAVTGMRLVEELAKLGFRHEFNLDQAQRRVGKWLFEVYPHPAMVRLFELNKIISYKKGTVGERRDGLAILRGHLRALADGTSGWVNSTLLTELLERDLHSLKGRALKHHEDLLDAVFCAFLAWHCWRWGAERNDMFGTLADGYIVVPKAPCPPPAAILSGG